MMAFLLFIVALALAIALAPIIIGVIGSMLALLFTALLYLFAGCPDNTPRKPTPAEQAEAEAPFRQMQEWAKEDAERAAKHAAEKAQRVGKAAARRARESIEAGLLEAQKRVHDAAEDYGHAP